jgi:ribosome-binding protein aMBF1 (putative translation factor)
MTIISDSDRRVGRALSSARQTAGWSKEQLAEAIGIGCADLAGAEVGRRRLQTAELVLAAIALKTPPEHLLGITDTLAVHTPQD